MSSKKVVTVFGATGVSGGSVAKYLLEDGTFTVRAVTRNANSDKAKALKAKGAEIVEADLAKSETLPATVKGAYGVVGLTDFWTIFPTLGLNQQKTQDEEVRQGISLVDAAKAAGVRQFVWFSLWHSNVPHWEGKYIVQQYLEKSGVPYTNFYNAFYYENMTKFGMLKRNDEGVLELTLPQPSNTYIPAYSAEQSGGWVLEALKNPDEWLGKDMISIGDYKTPKQWASVVSKAVGAPVKLTPLTDEEFEAQGKSENPFVHELWLNMKGFVDHCQPGPSSWYKTVEESKAIFAGQQSLEEYVTANEEFKNFVGSLTA